MKIITKKEKFEKFTREELISIIVILCIIVGYLFLRNRECEHSITAMDEIYREYFGEDAVDKMYEELYEKDLYEQDERRDQDVYELWRH